MNNKTEAEVPGIAGAIAEIEKRNGVAKTTHTVQEFLALAEEIISVAKASIAKADGKPDIAERDRTLRRFL